MVELVFDNFWDDSSSSKRYGKAAGDLNAYTAGTIGNHNVVLVHMPDAGPTSAATVAAGLRSSFRGIAIAFVVGVCGVTPRNTQNKEIILGDCIISTIVVQYDYGRQTPQAFMRKKKTEESLGRASIEVRTLTSKLKTQSNHQNLTKRLIHHLGILQDKRPDTRYPGIKRDRLFKASYAHQHHPETTCEACFNDTGICTEDCNAIGCEENQLVQRARFQSVLPGNSIVPVVHFGRIGSASTVMKSGFDRDRIAKEEDLIAFEMEGSGIWDNHSTVVIKSACDYADSHKSKEWQPYAAAVAAAGLKAFLEHWEAPDGSR